ncbi:MULTISPECIES: winged helix-turn-helix transcriptional regulator [Fusobacterium]|uniref:winged helix-turn-helix transcriptional regulator n=1 Tax=Fusobacterium TaxID=848 RepID=UPI0008A23D54|nr:MULTISPECIES: winged helix-turn-helix transcriptional regulator [Fusobacterium]MCF0170731.1 winged helix-turn-helix transcriptional regulator [Fusobacterium varium]MCF2673151.1 winged helix-turn-helix transcriptional regulator [Fusobacterium varium]MDY4005952.1 winged helix-turn-helix transcriptional regulator [Fusobacterium varium]OFL81679.1 transcriptional regulator [Fusobacterium sp. HMSC073F01]RGJ27588.1 winged helix-turn-helix transcriptional regulator [Fusobacterium varium]
MIQIKRKIISLIHENNIISQRKISEYLNISLGSVNKYINSLLNDGCLTKEIISYRKIKYFITPSGEEFLTNKNSIKVAVILAAGETLDFDKPVGFLKIFDSTLIERTIKLLSKYNIEKIIIASGYKSEFYKKLLKKYPNIKIIENKKYKTTGNMYSLYLLRKYLQEDFILLEGDLVFEETLIPLLLNSKEKNVTLIDTSVSNKEDSLYVTIKNGELLNISKGKYSLEKISGELIGISKLKYNSYLKMLDKFTQIENKLFFYEYSFLDKNIFPDLKCISSEEKLWGEIDNQKQYEYIKNNILKSLIKKEKDL